MTLLLLTLALRASTPEETVVVQPGETLATIASRELKDPGAASELVAINALAGEVRPGATLRLPGPARALAVSAIEAARLAVDRARASHPQKAQALATLARAQTLLREARYPEAATTADQAWQAISTPPQDATRFAVEVAADGETAVTARAGQSVRVEAQGQAVPLKVGERVIVQKGKAPPAPQPVLEAPSPTTPPVGGSIPAGTSARLAWKPVEGAAEYELALVGPKPLVVKVTQPFAALYGLGPGRYHWDVRALSSEGVFSRPSARWTFEVVDSVPKLEVEQPTWK